MTTVDFWPKTLPMPSVGSWNSTTKTHLLHMPHDASCLNLKYYLVGNSNSSLSDFFHTFAFLASSRYENCQKKCRVIFLAYILWNSQGEAFAQLLLAMLSMKCQNLLTSLMTKQARKNLCEKSCSDGQSAIHHSIIS